MTRFNDFWFRVLAHGLIALCLGEGVCAAEQLSAQAQVDRDQLFLGESFTLQIQVSGSDSPTIPDLSGLADFTARYAGGQKSNSSQTTIINGQVSHSVSLGFVMVYQLTPKRAGTLVIPPIDTVANQQTLKTKPIRIQVRTPAETPDFKVRQSLSRTECFVGEPITLTIIWYIGKNVGNYSFHMPLLDRKEFGFADPELRQSPGEKPVRIPTSGGEGIGLQGTGELDGAGYTTVTFRKVLIPRQPGEFQVDPVNVVFDAVTGYRRMRSPFGGVFPNSAFGSQEPVFEKVVVPSNPLKLKVAALPETGQPPDFGGNIGEYRIEVSATPTEVNIGDPITVTIALSGPEYLNEVELPPLDRQPTLSRDFKIPREMAPGRIEGNQKLFTQTIRATHAEVKEIPPIELSCFNPKSGRYEIAKSQPVPLAVRATRVVTAADAEGLQPGQAGSELEAWSKGIAHNYEDKGALRHFPYGPTTWFQSTLWLSLFGIPPLIYFGTLVTASTLRRRHADPLSVRARRAYPSFITQLRTIRKHARTDTASICSQLLDAVRTYIGAKLRVPAVSLTYADVEPMLSGAGADVKTMASLKRLFEHCEAGSYAGGGADAGTPADLVERAHKLVHTLEHTLK
ncbi:MAG: protein BatD [Lentisphaerales bacterium]|jgi:hypothetical protein|nr:MAG: protein BatD [Lentisphaerales bacterium]